MINDYLRGIGCIESVWGSVDFELLCILSVRLEFELFLALLYHFAWLCRFSCPFVGFYSFPSFR
jgi:hypothetical protein